MSKMATTLLAMSLQALFSSLAGTGAFIAQNTPKLLYDVSTVRPHDPADQGMSWGAQNGDLKAINVELKSLISDAWGVRPDQVAGEPAWADEEHWDVTGKVTDTQEDVLKKLTQKDLRSMEQMLLVERFHAKVHLETRTRTVFDLVPAKSGIKLKVLQPNEGDDKSDKNSMPRGSLSIRGAEGGGLEMTGHGVGVDMLISNIAMNLQQTVINKTGIPTDAVFDFTLKFAPETGTNPLQNDDAASIREALEKQLGLRLESTRGPVTTVVVDHVDKPTPN